MNHELSTNNLYYYATRELSQDAFLCWLLSHAMDENWDVDPQLRECAIVFIRKFYPIKSYERVTEIRKQYKNIDVLVIIGDIHIIIEDKTFTNSHNNQINNYKNTLIKEGIEEKNIICVYYKIIDQPYPEASVDFEFTRERALEVLRMYRDSTENRIYTDYVDYLEYIEEKTAMFKVMPIREWDGYAYRGFFNQITHNGDLDVTGRFWSWGYVNNPSRGFWGLWWTVLSEDDLNKMGMTEDIIDDLYLQIENNIIAVKISLVKDRIYDVDKVDSIRNQVYEYFRDNIHQQFKKKVYKKGCYMTVGYIEYDEYSYKKQISIMQDVMKSMSKNFKFIF